jgi:hypothetical protein
MLARRHIASRILRGRGRKICESGLHLLPIQVFCFCKCSTRTCSSGSSRQSRGARLALISPRPRQALMSFGSFFTDGPRQTCHTHGMTGRVSTTCLHSPAGR